MANDSVHSGKENPYLLRCLELALRSRTDVVPNPPVGAVLVYKDKIIGEGWHKKYGAPHAEVEAIRSVRKEHQKWISSSSLYVSLEPCNHYGKTPPCTELIIKNRIKRVIIGCKDPNPKVCGTGIQKLLSAGIEIQYAHKPEIFEDIIFQFRINQVYNRALITLKWAQSTDGKIGLKNEQLWLSNPYAGILSHKWRAHYDAILVGATTLLTDTPQLNNRWYPGKSPIRIVIDPQLRTLHTAKRLQKDTPLIIFNTLQNKKTGHIELIRFALRQEGLHKLVKLLYERFNIFSILVEGGPYTHQGFIDADLWDDLLLIQTKKILTGVYDESHTIDAAKFRGLEQKREHIGDNTVIYYRNSTRNAP